MNDDDRVRLAYRAGNMMYGPKEWQRCLRHPKRWVIYRWVWHVDNGPDYANPQYVRRCGACSEES